MKTIRTKLDVVFLERRQAKNGSFIQALCFHLNRMAKPV